MALITLAEAASRLDVTRETIEAWGRACLLTLHSRPHTGLPQTEPCVDEEELAEVAESLGWLKRSEDGWDSAEEK
jgi:hypothetical protein